MHINLNSNGFFAFFCFVPCIRKSGGARDERLFFYIVGKMEIGKNFRSRQVSKTWGRLNQPDWPRSRNGGKSKFKTIKHGKSKFETVRKMWEILISNHLLRIELLASETSGNKGSLTRPLASYNSLLDNERKSMVSRKGEKGKEENIFFCGGKKWRRKGRKIFGEG